MTTGRINQVTISLGYVALRKRTVGTRAIGGNSQRGEPLMRLDRGFAIDTQ